MFITALRPFTTWLSITFFTSSPYHNLNFCLSNPQVTCAISSNTQVPLSQGQISTPPISSPFQYINKQLLQISFLTIKRGKPQITFELYTSMLSTQG